MWVMMKSEVILDKMRLNFFFCVRDLFSITFIMFHIKAYVQKSSGFKSTTADEESVRVNQNNMHTSWATSATST